MLNTVFKKAKVAQSHSRIVLKLRDGNDAEKCTEQFRETWNQDEDQNKRSTMQSCCFTETPHSRIHDHLLKPVICPAPVRPLAPLPSQFYYKQTHVWRIKPQTASREHLVSALVENSTSSFRSVAGRTNVYLYFLLTEDPEQLLEKKKKIYKKVLLYCF